MSKKLGYGLGYATWVKQTRDAFIEAFELLTKNWSDKDREYFYHLDFLAMESHITVLLIVAAGNAELKKHEKEFSQIIATAGTSNELSIDGR